MKSYQTFLKSKRQWDESHGFKPVYMPDFLFDFQAHLTDWAVRKGRAALFEDCGLGKSIQEFIWAENLIRKHNKPVLILCPLAVSIQMVREGEKFGIEVHRTQEGKVHKGINVTNYQRLGYFSPSDFIGVVLDESSILKGVDRKFRRQVTEFMKKVPYRLLATATAAPNDYMELGTSSEALGVMPHAQMLGMFFINNGDTTSQWNLKGHAKRKFWQWVSTWARAVRMPSDIGFEDGDFVLPGLIEQQHIVKSEKPKQGFFVMEAKTLDEQRRERRETLHKRCEKVADLLPDDQPCLVWCHLNSEGDLLEKLIPDAVQVAGSDRDDLKERRLNDFSIGNIRVLVTKPKIGGFGMNWQHCSFMTLFPSHSFEMYYQAIRRCWRFGQEKSVMVNIVTSQAESLVLKNMQRKDRQAAEMFKGIICEMSDFQMGKKMNHKPTRRMELPSWM